MALQVSKAPIQPPLRVGRTSTPASLPVAKAPTAAPLRIGTPPTQPNLPVAQAPRSPALSIQKPPAAVGSSGTLADLGQLVKSKYPGAYDSLADEELGAIVQQKYPGAYDTFGAAPVTEEAPEKVGILKGIGRAIVSPIARAGATIGAGLEAAFTDASYGDLKQESVALPFLGKTKPAQSVLDGAGIAAELAANFIGGSGAVAAGKGIVKNTIKSAVATGAKAGAKAGALSGFGNSLQDEEKSIGSVAGSTLGALLLGGVFGAAIPAAGGLVRNANMVANTPSYLVQASRELEEASLRLTPVQKQRLGSKLESVTEWLSANKITGNPEARFNKVDSIYDEMEDTFQKWLGSVKRQTLSGTSEPLQINRDQLIPQINKLKKLFRDDVDVLAIERQIDGTIATLQSKYASRIPIIRLNNLKRSTFKNAFNSAGDKVRDDVEYAIGEVYKEAIEKATKGQTIGGVDISDFNRNYGTVIQARNLLKIAQTRKQVGLVGRIASTLAGGAVGSMLGPFGGAAGATVGSVVGEQVAGTAARSLVGSGLRTLGKTLGGR